MYSECLHCGATTIIPDMSLRDEGAYAAVNHQIIVEGNPTAIFMREPMAVQTRAYICGTCGYVALFVESPRRVFETYQRAQALREQQRIQDETRSGRISVKRIVKNGSAFSISLQRLLWAVAQPAVAADRFARKIGGFLKVVGSARSS